MNIMLQFLELNCIFLICHSSGLARYPGSVIPSGC